MMTASESGLQRVWLENMVYDLRYAIRSLARDPGFTLGVVGTLAFGIGANTAVFNVLYQQLSANSKTALYVLVGAVALTLLIGCANVGNLFVARALARNREFAIRAVIGASRPRIIRLLLFESLLLGLLGGAIGMALAWSVLSAVSTLIPQALPSRVSIDSHLFGFVFVCSVFTSLFFGLVAAVSASKPKLNVSLQQSRRSGSRFSSRLFIRNTLAVAQISLSVILLMGAGLLIRSFAVLSVSAAESRERAYLMAAFAALAVLIAAIGTYSVFAYSVTKRTQELGVRVALGAERRTLVRMILGQALRMSLVGVIVGVGAAFYLTHVLSPFLFEVTGTDPPTFVAVCGLLIASVCLASYFPARRATKVDPVVALRHE